MLRLEGNSRAILLAHEKQDFLVFLLHSHDQRTNDMLTGSWHTTDDDCFAAKLPHTYTAWHNFKCLVLCWWRNMMSVWADLSPEMRLRFDATTKPAKIHVPMLPTRLGPQNTFEPAKGRQKKICTHISPLPSPSIAPPPKLKQNFLNRSLAMRSLLKSSSDQQHDVEMIHLNLTRVVSADWKFHSNLSNPVWYGILSAAWLVANSSSCC